MSDVPDGVLLPLDGKYFIRSDRYCFSVCLDKGMTKFPGNIVRRYFKPFWFLGEINETAKTLAREDIEPCQEYKDFCTREVALFELLDKCKVKKSDNVSLHQYEIVHDKDTYSVKYGKKIEGYHVNLGSSLKSVYLLFIRGSRFTQWSEVVQFLDTFAEEAKKIIDSVEELV